MIINSVEEQLFDTGVPFYVHVTSDDGENALDWNAVLEQADVLSQMEQESELRSSLILSNISAPGILQLALDETGSDAVLSISMIGHHILMKL